MESFFQDPKGRAHPSTSLTPARWRSDIVDWIEGFYNRRRMQIGYKTPVDAESMDRIGKVESRQGHCRVEEAMGDGTRKQTRGSQLWHA